MLEALQEEPFEQLVMSVNDDVCKGGWGAVCAHLLFPN